MTLVRLIILSSVLLAACAHTPMLKPAETVVAQVQEPEKTEQADPTAQDVADTRVLPKIDLTDEMLFQFLLAEIANQRGENDVATDTSASLANKTRDPRVAMRAAQLAIESGQYNKAIDAIRLWQEVEPTSTVAKRMLTSVLLRAGKFDEAHKEIVKLFKDEPENVGSAFIQVYQVLFSYRDKTASLKFMQSLSQLQPNVAEGHWATAQMAQIAGEEKLAFSEIEKAIKLRPDWDLAASLEAVLLYKATPQASLDGLHNYLLKHPDAREIRLQYARALLDQKQFKLARDEFQRLAAENPDSADMAFAVALISFQMEDYQGAEEQFKRALNQGKKDQDTVHYYLGQLGEARKNNDEAIENYRLVNGGEYEFWARVRVAYLLSKGGEFAAAIQQLHQTEATNNQQRVQLIMVESKILFDTKQPDHAYHLLQHGLEKLPNNPDLLYETAMMAEKIGKLDMTEKLLRKLMQIQPNNPQAYNALGFSLLERNQRIPEAVSLVEKALQLAPNDAAIIDSVGWGYYLSGKLDESITMLRRAFASNPDPEIAAHLGEVLWLRGDKEEAKKIWQDSLKLNADSVPLQTVIKKFAP